MNIDVEKLKEIVGELHDPKGSHYRRQPAARFLAEFTLSEVRFFAPKRRGSE